MFLLYIFIIVAAEANCVYSSYLDIAKLASYFDNGFVQVCSDWKNHSNAQLLKQISLFGKMCRVNNLSTCAERYSDDGSLLLLIDDIAASKLQDLLNAQPLGKVNPVLIATMNGFQSNGFTPNITIDQQVFFINIMDNLVGEKYSVNNVNVTRSLGYGGFSSGKMRIDYLPGVSGDFFVRRKNFHGLHLNAMTDASGPNIRLNSAYMHEATYYKVNDTYDVSAFISGIYFDVWKVIEEELNVTATFYKRRVTGWASVSKDGKSISGMAEDLLSHRADIIISSLSLSLERMQFIDFMQVISSSSSALYIRSMENEAFRWTTFFGPFSLSLWLGILLWVALISVSLTFIESWITKQPYKKWANWIENVWLGFSLNFGGKPIKTFRDTSHKVALTSVLLGGTVIWIGYRSSLTSELSVVEKKLPFHSLEGLSRSGYQYAERTKIANIIYNDSNSSLLVLTGVLLANQISTAPSGSIFGSLRQNNVNENSFMKNEEVALEALIGQPNKAFFSIDHILHDLEEYRNCDIQMVWKPAFPNFPNSMATRKHSYLRPFLNNLIRKLKQTGTLDQIHTNNIGQHPNCNVGTTVKPLMLEKVFSIFFFLSMSSVVSLFLLVLERFWYKFRMNEQLAPSDDEADAQKCLQKIDELQSTIQNLPRITASGTAALEPIFRDLRARVAKTVTDPHDHMLN